MPNQTKRQSLQAPQLFACADRVQVPQVGSDDTFIKKDVRLPDVSMLSKMSRTGTLLNDGYLKKISSDMIFSEDVVREKAFHTLPYDHKYFKEILDYSDVVKELPKRFRKIHGLVGRHNNRVSDKKHLPCHLKKRSKHYLKPLKRRITERGSEMEQQSLKKESEIEAKGQRASSPSGQVFLTESKDSTSPTPQRKKKQQDTLGWDAYMLDILSMDTAQWVVHQRTSPGEHREQLADMLNHKYGPPTTNELVRDKSSEMDLSDQQEKPKKKWKKKQAILLQAVEATEDGLPTDPYGDDTAASFYRLPAGTRRQKKVKQKEDEGGYFGKKLDNKKWNNVTAKTITVTRQVSPPPPTMKDFLNPKVGSKIFNTENEFEREWLTGSKVLHQVHGDDTKIMMENNNKYKKQLRKVTPREPEDWFPETKEERKHKQERTTVINKLDKGMHRWTNLPQPVDVESESCEMKDTAEILNLQPPGTVEESENTIPATSGNKMKKMKNYSSLLQIVDDWRAKWHLNARFSDATPDDLIRDMADIHPHIRCKAITTCARAAEYKPPPQQGILISTEYKEDYISQLPEKIFTAVKCMCEDPVQQVQRAAAITLYVLNRPNEKAEEILRTTLRDGNMVDRWAAVQCLSHYGATDSEVVGELVAQLLNTEDPLKHTRCAELMAKLSQNTTLVHSMIAEQLNSSSWRHRVMACKVIPRLYGSISRDLSSKLTNLMWADWHGEVRKAAAQTLGRTGHGSKVHDRLRKQLNSSDERQKVDALNKIGKLGIMTAKLLPPFLACFDDEYLSVRMETCVACSNLQIEDPLVGEKLVFLASYDPIWKIKALAIQALGQIGRVTHDVRHTLLWALRYEESAGVRAEACHSVILLGLQDEEVQQILQDRFLVETSDAVKAEIAEALDKYGISDIEDIAMVAKIKDEVRKLCTRNNICAQISSNEAEDDLEFNRERLIYRSKTEKKDDTSKMYRAVSSVASRSSSRNAAERAVFSPTADYELERVLNREEDEDEDSDDSGSDNTSIRTRSQTTTASHGRLREDSTLSHRSSFYYGGSRFSEEDSDDGMTDFSISPSHGRFESSAYSSRSTPRTAESKNHKNGSQESSLDRVKQAIKSDTVTNIIKKHETEDYQLCEGIDLGDGETSTDNLHESETPGVDFDPNDIARLRHIKRSDLPQFMVATDPEQEDLSSSDEEDDDTKIYSNNNNQELELTVEGAIADPNLNANNNNNLPTNTSEPPGDKQELAGIGNDDNNNIHNEDEISLQTAKLAIIEDSLQDIDSSDSKHSEEATED